jgi:hypothetical protein
MSDDRQIAIVLLGGEISRVPLRISGESVTVDDFLEGRAHDGSVRGMCPNCPRVYHVSPIVMPTPCSCGQKLDWFTFWGVTR